MRLKNMHALPDREDDELPSDDMQMPLYLHYVSSS